MFITDRGRPAHVLLTFEEYKRLSGGRTKIADLLAMPGAEALDMDIPPSHERARAADMG